jgi:hypothetical protein
MPYRQKFPKLEPKNVQFWFKNVSKLLMNEILLCISIKHCNLLSTETGKDETPPSRNINKNTEHFTELDEPKKNIVIKLNFIEYQQCYVA